MNEKNEEEEIGIEDVHHSELFMKTFFGHTKEKGRFDQSQLAKLDNYDFVEMKAKKLMKAYKKMNLVMPQHLITINDKTHIHSKSCSSPCFEGINIDIFMSNYIKKSKEIIRNNNIQKYYMLSEAKATQIAETKNGKIMKHKIQDVLIVQSFTKKLTQRCSVIEYDKENDYFDPVYKDPDYSRTDLSKTDGMVTAHNYFIEDDAVKETIQSVENQVRDKTGEKTSLNDGFFSSDLRKRKLDKKDKRMVKKFITDNLVEKCIDISLNDFADEFPEYGLKKHQKTKITSKIAELMKSDDEKFNKFAMKCAEKAAEELKKEFE